MYGNLTVKYEGYKICKVEVSFNYDLLNDLLIVFKFQGFFTLIVNTNGNLFSFMEFSCIL